MSTESPKNVEIERDLERNAFRIGGQRVVVHCHHYNCFLQRTLEDALPDEMVDIQKKAAAEVVHAALLNVFSEPSDENREEFSMIVLNHAAELYRVMGLGRIDFSEITENGGIVHSPVSHYSFTWLEKWGSHDGPVCHFTCGFISAVLSIAYRKPLGTYIVNEIKCIVQKDEECVFQVEVARND